MYPLFGGYHEYEAAPVIKVMRHQLRHAAKMQVTQEQQEDQEREYRRQQLLG